MVCVHQYISYGNTLSINSVQFKVEEKLKLEEKKTSWNFIFEVSLFYEPISD